MIIISVLKTLRSEASTEYVKVARELSAYTLSKCVKIPKRYTYFVGIRLKELASNIYQNAASANVIYPQNKHEAQIRVDLLNAALGSCRALASQIEEAKDPCQIPIDAVKRWAELISEEERLLKGQRKVWRSKMKDLPD